MRIKRIALVLSLGVLVCAGFFVSQALHAGPPPPDAKYVGAKKCKACHMKGGIYKRWEAMKHATTFATLKAEDYGKKDPKTGKMCLACHTTGYGKPSGFKSVEETPKLTSVGCESCHGPGSVHVAFMKKNRKAIKAKDAEALKGLAASIDKNPGARCVYCHNPHISYKEHAKGK